MKLLLAGGGGGVSGTLATAAAAARIDRGAGDGTCSDGGHASGVGAVSGAPGGGGASGNRVRRREAPKRAGAVLGGRAAAASGSGVDVVRGSGVSALRELCGSREMSQPAQHTRATTKPLTRARVRTDRRTTSFC